MRFPLVFKLDYFLPDPFCLSFSPAPLILNLRLILLTFHFRHLFEGKNYISASSSEFKGTAGRKWHTHVQSPHSRCLSLRVLLTCKYSRNSASMREFLNLQVKSRWRYHQKRRKKRGRGRWSDVPCRWALRLFVQSWTSSAIREEDFQLFDERFLPYGWRYVPTIQDIVWFSVNLTCSPIHLWRPAPNGS